jgi:hypothetical protein
MEGFDAAVEHLGEAGYLAHIGNLEPGVSEDSGGAPGRNQLKPQF